MPENRSALAIHFDSEWEGRLSAYFAASEGAPFAEAVNRTDELIDGFQSPLGMEAIATVDWLITREHAAPSVAGIREALKRWPAGQAAAERKQRLFTDKLLVASVERLGQL